MASPVTQEIVTTSIATAADPWSVTMPADQLDDLIVLYGRSSAGQTFNLITDWTWILQNDASDATDDVTSIICIKSNGLLGSFISWDLSASAKGVVIAFRISGAADPASIAPLIQTAVGTGANPDPPSVNRPQSGLDWLVMSLAGLDGETQTFSHSELTNEVNVNSGTGGAVASNVRAAGGSAPIAAAQASANLVAWTAAAPASGWSAHALAISEPAPLVPSRVWSRKSANRFLTMR